MEENKENEELFDFPVADNDEEFVKKATKKKSKKVEKPVQVKPERAPRNESIAPLKVVGFKSWFTSRAQKDKRVKLHRRDEIFEFMKSEGLTDKEPAIRYERALNLYFGQS